MTISQSIRTTVRGLINRWGSNATLYSYSSATKITNEEGDVTVSWGSGTTTIKVISSNHNSLKRLLEKMGEENDESDRGILIRDDVTIGVRDKLVIGTDVYLVNEIKLIDPIQDTCIAKKITLIKDARYV